MATPVRGLYGPAATAFVLQAIGIGLTFWAVFHPEPAWLCGVTLALAPPVAFGLVAASGGRLSLNSRRDNDRPDIVMLCLGPALALGVRAMIDYTVVDWRPPLTWAAGIGALFVAAALAVDSREIPSLNRRSAARLPEGLPRLPRVTFVVGLVMAGLAYGWGLCAGANALLDVAPAVRFTPPVLSVRPSSRLHRSNAITLAPWGPVRRTQDIDVSEATFGGFAVGAPACVALRPGALGYRWYKVRPCGAASTTP